MPPPQQCPCNFRYVAQSRRSQHSHLLRAYRGVLLALGRQHTHRYRLADALTNISCGMTSQVVGVFLRIVGVGAYTAVYQNFALLVGLLWSTPWLPAAGVVLQTALSGRGGQGGGGRHGVAAQLGLVQVPVEPFAFDVGP